MDVNFICVGAAAFSAVNFNADKHMGVFVHLTEDVKNGETVLYPAGLYFGGTTGWEMLSNDTDVAAIEAKIREAIEELDTDADVVTASVANGVVTLTAGIAQEDGIIKKGASADIVLAKVATTGMAEDIKFAQYPTTLGEGETAKIAADSDLQTVMQNVIDSINDANADAVVTLWDDTAVATEVKADGKTYTLTQGTGDDKKTIATFNIVKDSFVKSGEVVYGSLVDGTFTPADAASDGSNAYIKLQLTTTDGSEESDGNVIYIAASELIKDVYQGVANADDNQYVKVGEIDPTTHKQTLSVTVGSFSVPATGDAEAVAQVPGLATVEDVERIIVDNEEVTAAALNDLNDRVEALENADAVVTTVAHSNSDSSSVEVTVSDNAAEGSNDHSYSVSAKLKWLSTFPE